MFVLSEKHLFWWPVTVRLPSPDSAGETVEQRFEVQFEALSRDRAAVLQDRMAAALDRDAVAAAELEQIEAVVRGWTDVVGPDGLSIGYTPERLRAACQWTWFRDAITRAYGEAMTGAAARLGN